MRGRLIKIGRSFAMRLSNAAIAKAGLRENDEIEAEVRAGEIVLRRVRAPREGWEESCKAMHDAGDDQLIDGPLQSLTKFDEEEWEW